MYLFKWSYQMHKYYKMYTTLIKMKNKKFGVRLEIPGNDRWCDKDQYKLFTHFIQNKNDRRPNFTGARKSLCDYL